jgi:hypothetical protein
MTVIYKTLGLWCPRAHSVYFRFYCVHVHTASSTPGFSWWSCCSTFRCFVLWFFGFVCPHSVSCPMLPVYLDCLFFSKVYLLFMCYTCYYVRSFLHIYQTKQNRQTINTPTSMYDIKTGKVHSWHYRTIVKHQTILEAWNVNKSILI